MEPSSRQRDRSLDDTSLWSRRASGCSGRQVSILALSPSPSRLIVFEPVVIDDALNSRSFDWVRLDHCSDEFPATLWHEAKFDHLALHDVVQTVSGMLFPTHGEVASHENEQQDSQCVCVVVERIRPVVLEIVTCDDWS